MEDTADKKIQRDDIFSRYVRAGKRTYFFDVKATKADDYYLTLTESTKRYNDDGTFRYEKHRLFLYKEDFNKFSDRLAEVMEFIIKEKGEAPIRSQYNSGGNYEKKESTDSKEVTENKSEAAATDASNELEKATESDSPVGGEETTEASETKETTEASETKETTEETETTDEAQATVTEETETPSSASEEEGEETSEDKTENAVVESGPDNKEETDKFTDVNFDDLGKDTEQNPEDAATIDAAEAAAATADEQTSETSEEENKS